MLYATLKTNNENGRWHMMKFDFLVQTRDNVTTMINRSV